MGYPIDESEFAREVRRELERARNGHAKLNSAHEAYSVILEELDEFWDQCRRKREDRHRGEVFRELVQIAAMAQRAAEDLDLPVLLHRSSYQTDEWHDKAYEETR